MSLQSEIGTFVSAVLAYFDTAVQQAAVVGTPYLALRKPRHVQHILTTNAHALSHSRSSPA